MITPALKVLYFLVGFTLASIFQVALFYAIEAGVGTVLLP